MTANTFDVPATWDDPSGGYTPDNVWIWHDGCGMVSLDAVLDEDTSTPLPLDRLADRALDLLEDVALVISRSYVTTGEDAPSAGQETAIVKARLLLAHLVGQLDRAAGGDGCGVPDEDVPEVE